MHRLQKEMTKLEINSRSYHRKFDGRMKDVRLGILASDPIESKIYKAYRKLGGGKIENYVTREDVNMDITSSSGQEMCVSDLSDYIGNTSDEED